MEPAKSDDPHEFKKPMLKKVVKKKEEEEVDLSKVALKKVVKKTDDKTDLEVPKLKKVEKKVADDEEPDSRRGSSAEPLDSALRAIPKREKTKLESAKKGPTTKKENGHSIDDVCRNLSGNFFLNFMFLRAISGYRRNWMDTFLLSA